MASEENDAATAENDNVSTEESNQSDDSASQQSGNDDGSEPLRPEGVKALNEWKKRARAAEKRMKNLESKLETVEQETMSEQEKALEEARKTAREEVLGEVKRDRLEASLIRAASGKLADPEDAARMLDLDEFDDPQDAEAISEAIDSLLEAKPYLGLNQDSSSGPRTSIDQGRRNNESSPVFTKQQIADMTVDEYEKHEAQIMEQLERGLIK